MNVNFSKQVACFLGTALLLLGLVSQAAAQKKQKVEFEVALNRLEAPPADADFNATLTVDMEIADGWHAYHTVPEGFPSPPVKLSLELPDGVTAVGQWIRPEGKHYESEDGVQVFKGSNQFTQNLMVSPDAATRELELKVSYQICTETVCMPPKKFKTSVSIAAESSPKETSDAKPSGKTTDEPMENSKAKTKASKEANKAPAKPPVFENAFFKAPVRLMVGGQPLNTAAKQMYPSPAMYDVDNDGVNELIVGDIFGTLNVYENENAEPTDEKNCHPVWSKHTALETAEGERITVSNW